MPDFLKWYRENKDDYVDVDAALRGYDAEFLDIYGSEENEDDERRCFLSVDLCAYVLYI